MHVGFNPAKLGASTTITISVRVGAAERASLSPLTSVQLRMPEGVSSGLNTLGVATCTAATLELDGPAGCSPNALLGRGSATVSVPLGAETISEQVATTVYMAPAAEEHTTMLFYASGTTPIISRLVFQGTLLGDSAPFGSKLNTTLPPVGGLPGAPDVAVVSMRTQIGPKDLKYYKRVHGVTVAYTPRGFELADSCPRGGFPFAAVFSFADGSHESATSLTPCPRKA